MKTMKAKDLKKILVEANRLAGRNPVIPILDYLLIDSGKLIVTNLQTWISWRVPFTGTFLCPIKELKSILATCKPADEVSITYSKTKGGVDVEINGLTSFKIGGDESVNTSDYPKTPQLSDKNIASLTLEDIQHIKMFSKIADKDELRPAMSSVMIGKTMVATNGHKLVWYDTQGKYNSKKDILIDRSVAQYLPLERCDISNPQKSEAKMSKMSHDNGKVQTYDVEYVVFSFLDKTVVTRLVDERYPNWKAVIPATDQLPITAVFDRGILITEITNALAMANKVTHQIRLLFSAEGDDGHVLISSEDLDFNHEYKKEITVNIDGEMKKEKAVVTEATVSTVPDDSPEPEGLHPVIEIGFNGQMLLELIKLSDANLCFFAMSAPNRATIIDGNALLMPVMLNNYV